MIKYLFILLILVACTPQKRLSRFVNHHPELVKTDTAYTKVVINDTVSIAGTEIDTFFMSMNTDTSRNEKTVLQVKKDSITVSIFQKGKKYNVKVTHPGNVIPIRKEIKIPFQTKTITVQPVKQWAIYIQVLLYGCIVIFFCFLIRWAIFKRNL